MSKILLRSALVAAVVGAAASALAADISGAGATFPYPVYSKWADTYKKDTGNGLNYQSIGSGGGIKQIVANTVTFGATDTPLKAEDLEKNGLVQWPQVMGGIVPVVNLDGVEAGRAGPRRRRRWPRSSSATIKAWNDPAIAKLNPGVKLTDAADRRRPSLGRFGHHLQLHRLPRQGLGRLEVQGRRRHGGRMAGRPRRQGQ